MRSEERRSMVRSAEYTEIRNFYFVSQLVQGDASCKTEDKINIFKM